MTSETDMTTKPAEPDETAVLGLLPGELQHTHGPRVAHPRPGFIAPTAKAGGDALPIHDTNPNVAPTRMSAPSRPDGSHASFTANNRRPTPHSRSDTLDRATVGRTHRTTLATVRALASVVLAITGYLLVRAATVIAGTASTPAGTAALVAAAGCGLLLIVAQIVSRRPQR